MTYKLVIREKDEPFSFFLLEAKRFVVMTDFAFRRNFFLEKRLLNDLKPFLGRLHDNL